MPLGDDEGVPMLSDIYREDDDEEEGDNDGVDEVLDW